MRLKKLILHGFKSFADRTEFSFDTPITGIVGPNGCGKSNVVDAFKWVLGEQSAKSLRGDAMMDVIFNGADARQPAGMAEVTLVFENPKDAEGKRALTLDMDEVSVGRRLFRDGLSEYQVNNQVNRLKDIRELFFDTGVGVDAYSVIEQGRVAAMLDANPAERRQIFEEAAGISKFKQRKKEAERKLERVDQNLLRVHDVLEELERRLRSVKAQATRARSYQEYSTKLAELRLSYAVQEFHVHKTRLNELELSRQDAQFRFDDASGDLASYQNQLASEREQLETLSRTKQQREHDLVQSRAAVQSARQRQQYAQQQLGQIDEQIAALELDKTTLESKLQAAGVAVEADTQRLKTLTEELAAVRKTISERQKAMTDGQDSLNDLDRQAEQGKASIVDLMRKLAQVSSRLGAVQIERKNAAGQQQRLEDRRRVVADEKARLESERVALQRELDETTAKLIQEQESLESKRSAAQHLGKQIAQVGEQLGAAREHRSGLLSRQKLLQDLEARRQGVSEGVKSVLRQRDSKFPFVRGLLADVLGVDVDHAPVIEAALDGRDQWLVATDTAAAIASRDALDALEGRVNLLCVDTLPPAEACAFDFNQFPHRVRLAVDLVRFDPSDAPLAHSILGKTIVVENLEAAIDLHKRGPTGCRYVTHDGQVLEADGTLKAGPLSADMGLLSRRSELAVLVQQIADTDGRIEQLAGKLAEDHTAARSLEEEIGNLRNSIYAVSAAKASAGVAVAQNSDGQAALERERILLESELRSLVVSQAALEKEEGELTNRRQAHEAEQTEIQKQVEEWIAAQRQMADELRQLAEQLTAARVQFGQVQEQQLACDQAVKRQTAAQAELRQQIERVSQSAVSVASRREIVEGELTAASQAEAALLEAEVEHQQKLENLSSELSTLTETVKTLAGQVDSVREARQEIEQKLHQLEVSAGEENVRLQTLTQRTQEELNLDVAAKYAELTADGTEYKSVEADWDAVASQIKELREKIHRLGNVNVDAIGEQTELEQREQFLSAQLADLSASKQQLTELIDQINRECGERFETTFNAVREHFQGMFRKLFGGGKADIYLETELAAAAPVQPAEGEVLAEPAAPVKVDILDAGIEIIARPPGKQPVSISQLSGGEKTMTCVALLLSIFKSKPSPFCILDEVDAALDEANNARFNAIVQEFLDQSQFIVITHSKRTMQIADVLYGVTMQEQGVSKRVSVRFDQVGSQGEIAETAAA
jgi:chromosome segregation protein